jgi:2'-5' RNA ligase
MNELDTLKQKISKLAGSPLPAIPEESLQDKVVPINKPQKAESEDYTRRNPENIPIIMKGANHSGAMMAIYIPKDVAEKISIEDGESAEDLHITLFYFGENADLSDVDRNKITSVMRKIASDCRSFRVSSDKTKTFPEKDGEMPFVALVDSAELMSLRKDLADSLDSAGVAYSKDFDYTPHITIKYLHDEEAPDVEYDISFSVDSLACSFGKGPPEVKAKLKKGMDTAGDMYDEGVQVHQQYSDMNAGKNRIGDKDEPLGKASFSADAPTKPDEPIIADKQQEKIEKMLIPVLSVVHYKNGSVKTSIRWKNPESIGVKKITSKSPLAGVITIDEAPYFTLHSKIKQTMYYLADQDEVSSLQDNELLQPSEDDKYGAGIYLYSDLDKAKEANTDNQTLLPVKVNIVNPLVISSPDEWKEESKNTLSNVGYDSIYIMTKEARVFNLIVIAPNSLKVIGQSEQSSPEQIPPQEQAELQREPDEIQKSDDFNVDVETLKKLQCCPCEEEPEDETLQKATVESRVIQTPTAPDGSVDYDKVQVGQTIWVTVTKEGPLHGRHIQITKRPDGMFAITGGSGYNQIKDKSGTFTPTASLRHLVVGGHPQKTSREKEIDVEVEEEKKVNAPLIEKKKELISAGKKKIDEALASFKESIGASDDLTTSKLKTHREELISQATKAGLSDEEGNAFVSTLIRHVAGVNKQLAEQRSRETGLKELQLYNQIQSMKDNGSPEAVQQALDNFNSEIGDFRSSIKIATPSAEQFKGLTREEIDGKIGSYVTEEVNKILNPDPTEKTLDEELKAEGIQPSEPPESSIEIIPEIKPLEIKSVEALKDSVDKYKNFHQVQNELSELKRQMRPKAFAQVTPELLEQLSLEVKAITPQVTDEDIEEIEKSYEDQYVQNNSAIAFYDALGEFWNDKTALTDTSRVDNGLGQYINSGATGALAALTGAYFGERFEAETLIEKTSIETAAYVAAFKLRDEYAKDVSKFNTIINNVSSFNAKNQMRVEKEALAKHKELQAKYNVIRSEEEKGTLTSEAFLTDAQISNLIDQKNNLGTALGSLQASAAFLESLIVARDAKDKKISIDFGGDAKGAELRRNELRLGEENSTIDSSDPKHIRLVAGVQSLQKYARGQEVIKSNYDKNEALKNNMENTFTDSEGNTFVNEGTYKVPFWKDNVAVEKLDESNGQVITENQKHFFRVEQRNDIEWLKNQGGGVISRPTGTGKTNASLGFFANKIAENPNYSAVAVVPKGRVSQWISEANKFTDLKMVEIHEGLTKDKRREMIASIKPGQIAVISHRDAVVSYDAIKAAKDQHNLFNGMVIDEPQELASKSVRGNMSAAVRKLTQLAVENRVALTATPARDNLVESYDLVNWASHHDSSLGPRSRFQKIYGGYGSGTNAQDATLQQMIYREISPFLSGGRLTNPNFKISHDDIKVSKTPVQDANMKDLEKNVDKYVSKAKDDFIKEIEANPEDLRKWEKNGRDWRKKAGAKAAKKAKAKIMSYHWDNLGGTFGDKMKWSDNPKVASNVKNILGNTEKKHVVFIDNNAQRNAIFNGLTESGLKKTQVENIASTATSGGITGTSMSERVKNFKKNKDVRVIFIDRASASGYNLQEGDTLHVMGTPSDAANYLQAQGRLARMPRVGDVNIRTYRYSDAPFEDQKWTKLDTQLKILRAVAPSMFPGGK